MVKNRYRVEVLMAVVGDDNPHYLKELDDLHCLMTIEEVAELYQVHPNTVRYWINTGLVSSRNTGKLWLISKYSLFQLVGKPQEYIANKRGNHGKSA